MKPSRLRSVLTKLVETRWPAFVWGPPGVGKSAIVRDVARRTGRDVLDVRASLLDPTDIRGIPTVVDGQALWCPPSFLPSDSESKGILFLDELNTAPPLVQASLYQLTLDRRAGEYRLPKGWSIVAAGNRAQDLSLTFRMPAALSNRFVHLDFEVNFEDWRDWATSNDINPLVVAFLSFRPGLLMDMKIGEKGFPTPRSWEMASDTLNLFEKPEDAADVLAGVVGEAATAEFSAFLAETGILKMFDQFLEDPATAPIPKRIDVLFALVGFMTARIKEPKVFDAALVSLERLEPEIAVVLARDIGRLVPTAVKRPEVRQFLRKNRSVILS